jgi:hypothetical protein
MQPLINKTELRSILQRGLLSGKWSVLQFNRGGKDPILPSKEFLEEYPQFLDMEFRDSKAFKERGHTQ